MNLSEWTLNQAAGLLNEDFDLAVRRNFSRRSRLRP